MPSRELQWEMPCWEQKDGVGRGLQSSTGVGAIKDSASVAQVEAAQKKQVRAGAGTGESGS